jgi:hypothetical protein
MHLRKRAILQVLANGGARNGGDCTAKFALTKDFLRS